MALLNIADAIYLGDRTVDRVYVGPQWVWPPGAGPVYVGPQAGTGRTSITNRRPIVFKVNLPTDGEIVEIVTSLFSTSQEFKMLLYADNGGVPDELVFVSDSLDEEDASLPVSIPVSAGSYWLGVVARLNNVPWDPLVPEPGMEFALGDFNSWPSWTQPVPTEWVGGVSQPARLDMVPYVGLWYVPAE